MQSFGQNLQSFDLNLVYFCSASLQIFNVWFIAVVFWSTTIVFRSTSADFSSIPVVFWCIPVLVQICSVLVQIGNVLVQICSVCVCNYSVYFHTLQCFSLYLQWFSEHLQSLQCMELIHSKSVVYQSTKTNCDSFFIYDNILLQNVIRSFRFPCFVMISFPPQMTFWFLDNVTFFVCYVLS